MKMAYKCKSIAVAMGLGLVLASGSAIGGVTWYSPITAFEDDDLDWHIDTNQNGTIDVGERLRAVLELERTFSVIGPGGPTGFGGDELTGIADITVLTKTANGDGTFNFTFGPSAAFEAETGVTGAMVALWLDPSPDLEIVPPNCASSAACDALASDGALWAVAGFGGDADETWRANNALDTPALAAAEPATSKVGVVNFALSVLVNNTGQILGLQNCGLLCQPNPPGDGLIQVRGAGDLLGGQGLTNGAFARSDFDFQLAPVRVPEPGTLALLAVGLIGLGAGLRKRMQ